MSELSQQDPQSHPQQQLAEAVRDACIEAALEGYENAAMSGLCQEGAWEAAISSIRMVNIEAVLAAQKDA